MKFNEKINYGLLPRPHFSAKDLSILRKDKEIAAVTNLKVYRLCLLFFYNQEFYRQDSSLF